MKIPFDARTGLAVGITGAAMIGITILSCVVISTIDGGVTNRAQNVFNAVLPLFGTWVGTVLAYYFSRENFEAASDSTKQLVHDLKTDQLRSKRVTEVMTRTIFSQTDLKIKTIDILKELSEKNVKRVLVLKPSGALEALLYMEGIFSYFYSVPEEERSNKTLADLLIEKPELKQTPAYVREDATLEEAVDKMQRSQNCKVVLVTKTGDAKDRVLGLLTHADIARYSKA